MASKAPNSRGEKILRLTSAGIIRGTKRELFPAFSSAKHRRPVHPVDDGRVWERYHHEHDSFFRMIDVVTLKSLKDHFSYQTDPSSSNVLSMGPTQQPSTQPSENHHESHVASVVDDSGRTPIFSEGSNTEFHAQQPSFSPVVMTNSENKVSSNPAEQLPAQPSNGQLESQVAAEFFSQDVSTEDQLQTHENDSNDLVYLINSDDSVKDPDFDVEKCKDLGSDDCLESSDEENDEKKIRPSKRKAQESSSALTNIDNTVENLPREPEEAASAIKKGRRKISDPSAWKRNQVKKLRNEGQQYVPTNGKKSLTKAREMKPSSCSEKCIHKCIEKFTTEERECFFHKYWQLGDITRQREFITKHSAVINPEYRYPKGRRRQLNHAFYFSLNGIKKRVCKKFFMDTLDINRRTVATAFSKQDNGIVSEDLRGKHTNHVRVSEEIKDMIRGHINSIPRIESHYLRKQTSREYIEGGKSVASLYRDYKKECEEANREYGSLSMYTSIFNQDFNISFFVPKKDRCETCTVYDLADEEAKASLKNEYDVHHQEKELARLEKKWDKEFSNDNVIACCYDLQAAFYTPQGEASIFYYKSKLSTYNLSIYDLKTGETVNNVWHEGEANRGAVEIATCVYKFIEQKATSTDKKLKFVFFSDNCSGQQKNKYVFVMYMFCLRKFKNVISISHKFLITGHTQNEGDCVHSVIEKAVKRARKSGPIYVPSQFVQIIRTAKVKEPFYVVREFSSRDIIDFKILTDCIGGNFNVNERGNKFLFTEIKSFLVTQDDPFRFYYRTSFDGELEAVNVRDSSPNVQEVRKSVRKSRRIKEPGNRSEESTQQRLNILDAFQCPPAYNSPRGISQNKMNDLLSLIKSGVIPNSYRDFYEQLPIKETIPKKKSKNNTRAAGNSQEETQD